MKERYDAFGNAGGEDFHKWFFVRSESVLTQSTSDGVAGIDEANVVGQTGGECFSEKGVVGATEDDDIGSGSEHSSWMILGAQVLGDDDAVLDEGCFLIPAADVEINDDWRADRPRASHH